MEAKTFMFNWEKTKEGAVTAVAESTVPCLLTMLFAFDMWLIMGIVHCCSLHCSTRPPS